MLSAQLLQQFEPTPTGIALDYERQLWQARYSPCGRFLIAGGYDATVQRWEVGGEQYQLLSPLTGHHGWVQCLDFAPSADGSQTLLLTADSWGALTCWNCAEAAPQPVWTLPAAHDGWIRALAVSRDGATVATGGNDRVVRLWSTADGNLQGELPHPDPVFSLAFHPGGASLASGDLKGVIRDWSLATRETARSFDARLLYRQSTIQDCGGARVLSFDAAGRWLACGGQKNPQGGFATGTPCVLVFDWAAGSLIREMSMGGDQDGFAYDARFHPAGFLMGASCAFPGKGHVWFWRPEDESAFYSGNSIPNARTLSLHPRGDRLALLVSLSANGNGRPAGEYSGGTAKVHVLKFGAEAAAG